MLKLPVPLSVKVLPVEAVKVSTLVKSRFPETDQLPEPVVNVLLVQEEP